MRERHAAGQRESKRVPIDKARANRIPIDWQAYEPPKPAFTGLRVFEDWDLADLAECIDWTPFFQTWELAGKYPQILDDPKVGAAARSLFEDAQGMLKQAIAEKWTTPRAVIGFWPANAVGDDIEVYADDDRAEVRAVLHSLRQQMERNRERPHAALADFVAPKETGKADWIGGFAVTSGTGLDEKAAEFEARNDDYNSILAKALSDRLAEAFAERMHERVRKEFWGYAPDEHLSNQQLIAEEYKGIRPAPGYPACPDHTEKPTLFALLDAENTAGIALTESMAMTPGSAVSGLYFSHPQSTYFGLGKIGRDQVEDYAVRKGMTLEEIERWLGPNLNYEPGAAEKEKEKAAA